MPLNWLPHRTVGSRPSRAGGRRELPGACSRETAPPEQESQTTGGKPDGDGGSAKEP